MADGRVAGPCFQTLPVFPRTITSVGENQVSFQEKQSERQKPKQLEAWALQ